MASNVAVRIIADYLGKSAFKKAETDVQRLNRNVKNLARTFGVAFGTAQVIAFSKASVKAFAADEAAATRLAGTLNNLGYSYRTQDAENFIKALETQFHVADDKLRPAFQALIQQTQSYAASQKILRSALDLSAASGVDVTQAATDLGNAYLGITKGMKKYNLGMTQAELKTASFEEILKKVNTTFKGQASAATLTYKGKIDALTVAFGNMQETIGKGIVDAFGTLTSDPSMKEFVKAMDDTSTNIADMVRGIGNLGTAFKNLPVIGGAGFQDFIQAIPVAGSYINMLINSGKKSRVAASSANTGGGIPLSGSALDRINESNAAKAKAQELAAKKRAAELAKLAKAQTKATEDNVKLKKLGAIFDMQQIQIMAALKGKISDEDRKKLELQLALVQGNESEAEKLAGELAKAQGKSSEIAQIINSLKDSNPFTSWSKYLDGIEEQLKRIANENALNSAPVAGTPLPQNWVPQVQLPAPSPNAFGPGIAIDLSITGGGDALTDAIADALQNRTASGLDLTISRNNPSWSAY